MRRKPSSNNYGKQRRGSQGKPKRNYGAAREKYLAQARDALSSGDRVMAEYYYQHAEHCFRMLAEDGGNRNQRQQGGNPRNNQSEPSPKEETDNNEKPTEKSDSTVEQLPAFITGGAEATDDASKAAADSKE